MLGGASPLQEVLAKMSAAALFASECRLMDDASNGKQVSVAGILRDVPQPIQTGFQSSGATYDAGITPGNVANLFGELWRTRFRDFRPEKGMRTFGQILFSHRPRRATAKHQGFQQRIASQTVCTVDATGSNFSRCIQTT